MVGGCACTGVTGGMCTEGDVGGRRAGLRVLSGKGWGIRMHRDKGRHVHRGWAKAEGRVHTCG